jgi:putative toxin-antitoxin system antitoxin component (TIGR02293 family)
MATPRSTDPSRRVTALLGGPKVVGIGGGGAAALQSAVREGLPYGSFESVRKALRVGARELAAVLGVAPRTLARRKLDRHLSAIESDRLYRIAHVAMVAEEVLGSPDRARAWLRRSNRALGGELPIGLLDTEIGARRVEDVLLRLDAGVLG